MDLMLYLYHLIKQPSNDKPMQKESYFYEVKFNSERFDDNKLLEAMALYRGERVFTIYSRMGSRVQSSYSKYNCLLAV